MAIQYLNNVSIFSERILYYAALISAKCGGLVPNVGGFIDGTLRPADRSTINVFSTAVINVGMGSSFNRL